MADVRLQLGANNLPAFINNSRLFEAIEKKLQAYPIAKEMQLPVTAKADNLIYKILDIDPEWIINAISSVQIIVQHKNGEFDAMVYLSQKSKYSTIYVQMFCRTKVAFDTFEKKLRDKFEDVAVKGTLFSIRWAYDSKHGLTSNHVTELYEDKIIDECYPTIKAKWGSVENFVKDYTNSNESVLVLQGPPGTGKTRLIRKILAQMANSRINETGDLDELEFRTVGSNQDTPIALYTGDKNLLKNEEIFASFVHASEKVLVIEDADLMLKPRADGNEIMHHFLMVADGVIQGSGRKIIFSTNLANTGDIDEALVRPGRCYALLNVRNLTGAEAKVVTQKIYGKEVTLTKDKYTAAELYNGRF